MVGEVTFAVLGLLFLIADIRTFASTFQLSFFGQSNTTLGLMAAAVFGTSLLAPLVGWQLGPRRSVALSAAMLGIATLLATVTRNNLADLGLSIAGIAGGMWWLGLLHSARAPDRASPLPAAIPIALIADLALRAGFRTIPVVDLNLTLAAPLVLVAALVFFAAGLASLGGEKAWMRPDLRGGVALIALPSVLFLAEVGGTNGAQTALAAGLGLGPEPARATQIGMVLVGLGLASGTLTLSQPIPRGVAGAIAVVAGTLLLWYVHAPVVSLLGGLLLAAGLVIAAAIIPAGPQVATRAPFAVTLALAAGWLAFAAAAFGFYAFWAFVPAIYAAAGVVAAGAVLGRTPGDSRWRLLPMALVPIVVGAPLAALLLTPAAPPAESPRATFRVMTFNVHQGFNAGQVPSLDLITEVVAREAPDVLLLQEVVRGWMLDEQHDVLSVLSERLAMPYVFAPSIGDLYGNAILSRFPMTDVRRVRFATQPSLRHQPRGAVGVRINDVVVIATHLDEVADASAVRQEQVRAILSAWDGERAVIIAGDLNAEPGTLEIGLLAEAGYGDLAEPAGPTTTMSDPPKRIDYIFGIGVLGSNPHTVMSLGASDHRAVVVNVTRIP